MPTTRARTRLAGDVEVVALVLREGLEERLQEHVHVVADGRLVVGVAGLVASAEAGASGLETMGHTVGHGPSHRTPRRPTHLVDVDHVGDVVPREGVAHGVQLVVDGARAVLCT